MKTPYDHLPLVPTIIAEVVTARPLDGHPALEAKRQRMTREFADLCESRCRTAYDANAKWMLKIARMRDGRDALATWIRHWLVSYLHNPAVMRRDAKCS
jgi:hypothetical protein